MKNTTILMALVIAFVSAATNPQAQKNKTVTISVTAAFDEWVEQSVDPANPLPALPAAVLSNAVPYTGGVTLDGGFQLDSNLNFSVQFASGAFAAGGMPQPSESGVNFSMGAHNVGKVRPGLSLAGQAGLTWTDATNGYAYRLQYGDVYDLANVDYAHIRCVAPETGESCTEWVVSTLPTDLTPTGTGPTPPLRRTGPRARLSVTSRSGAKGQVNLGYIDVPFSIRIHRN